MRAAQFGHAECLRRPGSPGKRPTPDALHAWVAFVSADPMAQEEKEPEHSMTAPDAAASLPLSENELASWLAHRLDPASFAGNITHALRLVGPIDEATVQRALQRLVDRHPVLRARYTDVDGQPRRVEQPHELVTFDLLEVHPSILDAELAGFAHHHFDLQTGPVFRVRLFRLAADDHVLACSCHHIVADMWSLVLLIDDFLVAYRLEAGLGGDEPAPPPSTYADFAARQAAELDTDRGRAHEAFWTQHLAGGTGPLRLPADRPRPAHPLGVALPVMARVPAALRARLESLAAGAGCTVPDVLLTAFQVLLHRYTGRDDVTVGMPKANRSMRTARVVGCFMNPVAVRTDLRGDPSFHELLERTAHATREVAAHDRYPILTMAHRRSPGAGAVEELFDVVFSWQKSSRAIDRSFTSAVALGLAGVRSELDGLVWETVAMPVRPAPVDVSLLTAEVGDELGVTLEYRTDVFDRWRAEAMVRHYLRLLAAAADDPACSISRLPMLSATEYAELTTVPTVSEPRPPTVHEAITERSRQHPDRVAVTAGDETLTYAELDAIAERVARGLAARGVHRGDVVGVHVERSIAMVAVLLAVMKTGAAYLPLDPAFPAERLRFMIADADVVLVVTSDGDPDGELADVARVDVADLLDPASPGTRSGGSPPVSSAPNDLAYVIYTSGSTGVPKGVQIEHRQLRHFVDAFAARPGIGPSDVVLSITTLSFDPSVVELLVPLVCGARIELAPPDAARDPALLATVIQRVAPTVLQATPTTWRMLLGTGWQGHPDLRIFSGGEALTPGLAADLLTRGSEVWNLYGPTETTVWCTAKRIVSAEERITIGTAIGAMTAQVLDRHGQPLPAGVPGELVIGGPSVARGYRNRPELDAERFVRAGRDEPRRYRTGDLAQLLPNGELEHLGRIDRQVKIRGHRIELGEIEARLTAHPAIRAAVVIGRTYGPDDDRLIAYTVAAGNTAPSSHELREHLGRTLPRAMLPASYVTLPALPLTPTGKVDTEALPPPGSVGLGRTSDAPHPGIEATIAAVWSEVLRRPAVGRDDDFFDLGGNSLLATMIVSRLRSTLGVELPVRAVFESSTVARLAHTVLDAHGHAGSAAPPRIAQVDRAVAHPLSPAQERMWFLQQLEPRGTAYNLSAALRARGELDVEAFGRALDRLVDRHESLRTWFGDVDGTPVQRISPPLHVEVPLVDHSALSFGQRFDAARRAIRAAANEPYDLRALPLLRVAIHRLGPEDHVLFFGTHHITADQWSFGVLGRELAELYRAERAGGEAHLPELTSQHVDYAVWHRTWLASGAAARQVEYWQRQLAGVPVIDLPADRTRPPAFTSAGDVVVVPLPAELSDRVARLGAAANASSFMVHLACFVTLVHRYTGASDVPIGSPVANRNRLESEHLLSSFVNTLVLRIDLDGDPSFAEVVRRVRAVALDAFANQDVPFDRLVGELQPARDPSRSPLFQLFFNLQNAPAGVPSLEGLDLEIVTLERQAAQFDLSMSIDSEWSQTLSLEYRTDLFDRWRVEAMAEHFLHLLRAAMDAPTTPVSRLSMLTDAERAALAAADAAGLADLDPPLAHTAIAARAATTGERIAVTFGQQHMTYAELDAAANRLAHHLRAGGVERGDIVGIHLERSIEMVVAVLGVLRAGAAYLPLDPGFPADRLRFMVTDSRCRVVLTTSDVAMRTSARCVEIDRIDTTGHPPTAPSVDIESGDLAYVIYTSGSTGQPKGVQIEHGNLANFLAAMAVRPGLTADDRMLSVTTLSFDISVLEIFGTLATGGHLVVLDRDTSLDPTALNAALTLHRPTIMQATPTTWRMLVAGGWAGLPGLKVLCGGEPLTADLATALHARGAELWNMYGPTETTVWSTAKRITEPTQPITIGTAIANTTLRILDPNRQALPTGVPGELYIGGAGVARGYLARPELTAERFVPDPDHPGGRLYATGDLARLLPGGEIEHLGRIDHQVKVRGHRIELGEIEAALASHPAVDQAVVTTHEFDPGDVRLVAYVTGNGAVDTAALREHVKATLPAYMVPAAYVRLDTVPLTPNKKVDRAALPAPASAADTAMPGAPPRPGLETTIAGIWRAVLGVPTVTRDSDFFELGGHSLLAVRVFADLERLTGQRFPLTSLFRAPTVAGMAELLASEGWASAFTSLVPVQPNGTRRPLFVVAPFLITSLSFANLARLLGDDQPLYALQPQGLESDHAPHTTVEEMAAHYIREMRRVQPQGPYALAGHCAGSWVAFEVAAQLQSVGDEVAPLVLVDSEPPGVEAPRRRWVRHIAQRTWHYSRDRRLRAALIWKLGVFRERLRASRGSDRERDRVAMVRRVHAAAHRRYGGTVVKGDAVLIRSEESVMLTDKDWHLAWADVITGELHVEVVPGAHSALLERPNVDALADHVRSALDRVV